MSLQGKTLLITGASRGIGLAIALRAAHDGANIAILAKTIDPHPKLPGTIFTAAAEIEAAGGKALPLACDIRFEDQVQQAVAQCAAHFGGIDICINNASAISLTSTEATGMKRYDLMHSINTRGTFLVTKTCVPHLRQAANPHVLNIAPPLDMRAKWFAPHVAYTMSKFGMSLCVLGMAEEFLRDGIAVNALWPRTLIWTAAVANVAGGERVKAGSRKPAIMADAAHLILTKPSREFTANFCIDEPLLASHGMTDFSPYAIDPTAALISDFFLPDDLT